MKQRAITGLGIVSAFGIGREAFMRTLADPPVNEAPHAIESFDASSYPGADVAEVRGFDPSRYLGDKGLRTLDRLTKLLIVGARLALDDSGLKKDGAFAAIAPSRVGLVCSNAYGSLEAITELDRVALLEDPRYINPAKFPNTVSNSAAGYVSIWEDLRAINVSVSNGNCGGLDAMNCADIYFAAQRADALLVGGGEALSEALYFAFSKIGALRSNAGSGGSPSRLRLGEGASFYVVEPIEMAKARGANILAEIVGYGTSFVGPQEEDALIAPSAEAMRRAIQLALADANLKPTDVDVVVSGASGLSRFDDAELSGINESLGMQVPVLAPKSWLGETLGAGGAMAVASAVAWMQAPASNYPVLRGTISNRPRTALITALGYYGNASALIVRATS